MLSLAGQEPSQPETRADVESFPQTFQPGTRVDWDEVACSPGFHPFKIHPPVSPWA
jgi:hypothetical protein